MAETRHTPGPWIASHPMQDSGGNFAIEIGGKVAAGPISVAWVMLGAGPTPQERADGQADAHLIAAAPELLAALQLALRESGCDGDLCAHEWHEVARAAIAKAEARHG